jgi:hypothetical protein
MTTAFVPNESLSQTLRSALDTNHDGQVTLGEVVDRVAERGFGLLLILLNLPMLVPMPPGTSGPVGILLALLGAQMLLGAERPWLPARARAYRLSGKIVQTLQKSGVALMERVERFSRPRWTFVENPLMRRVIALITLCMGILLFLPIPGMNTFPAILLLILAVGLLNRDGILLLVGTVASASLLIALVVGFLLMYDRLWPMAVAWAQSNGIMKALGF